MFSKLPDLFSREFAVGFFIPAILFLLLVQAGLDAAQLQGFLEREARTGTETALEQGAAGGEGTSSAESGEIDNLETLISVSLFTLLAWLLALLLAALNTPLYKLLEGYWGRWQNILGLKKRQLHQLARLRSRESALWDEVKTSQENGVAFTKDQEFFKIRKALATRFPNEDAWVLPTSFGNILRAFETYSNTMFGIDAIPSWYRLLALIPESYRKDIDQAKAYVDFWINLWYLSLLSVAGTAFLAWRAGVGSFLWFIPVFLGLMWLFFQGAKDAAVEWGEFVKAGVELYKGKLQAQLSFPKSDTKDQVQEVWQRYSSAISFRDPDLYPFAPAADEKEEA